MQLFDSKFEITLQRLMKIDYDGGQSKSGNNDR